MSETLYHVSANPHVRDNGSTQKIMLDVIIALLPATIFGIYIFGASAALTVAISVATCVVVEYIYQKLMKQPITVGDLSAALTGLLLALNLPSGAPFWMPILGGIFAIIVVKQVFGGLGQNFMNPALGARCFLMISFAARMTTFTYDGVTTATPLAVMEQGKSVDVMKSFLGFVPGTIGETSALLLIIGGAYLVFKKVISPIIPCVYVAVVAIFVLIFGGHGFDLSYMAAQIFSGGLMFRCDLHGNRLRNISNYQERKDHLCDRSWYFNWIIPSVRTNGRRCILLNHHCELISSTDRESDSTNSIWNRKKRR